MAVSCAFSQHWRLIKDADASFYCLGSGNGKHVVKKKKKKLDKERQTLCISWGYINGAQSECKSNHVHLHIGSCYDI